MDEFEDFENVEDSEPIEGQICYDELEPMKLKVKKRQQRLRVSLALMN